MHLINKFRATMVCIIPLLLGACSLVVCSSGRHSSDVVIDNQELADMKFDDVVNTMRWNLHLANTYTNQDCRIDASQFSILFSCPQSKLANLPPVTLQIHKESISHVLRRASEMVGLKCLQKDHWLLIAPIIRCENLIFEKDSLSTHTKLEKTIIPIVDWFKVHSCSTNNSNCNRWFIVEFE